MIPDGLPTIELVEDCAAKRLEGPGRTIGCSVGLGPINELAALTANDLADDRCGIELVHDLRTRSLDAQAEWPPLERGPRRELPGIPVAPFDVHEERIAASAELRVCRLDTNKVDVFADPGHSGRGRHVWI